ncbi:MAG: hypothetical protein DLM69_08740 [Candidatus Chloroheliales bacterium]|nr:MAG: hypothetical protein DLM69_08740 [Chloroflexota bacterium]
MLRIYLLGDIHMEAEGSSLKLPLPSTFSLWAYLLLHRHAPVLRDTLAPTLWPDDSEAEARAKLSRQLYRLRSALPDMPANPPWLLTTATTVQWNPTADFWLDIVEFEHLSASLATIPAAVEGYGGDLLPGVYDDWLLYERERLLHLYIADLEQLVQHYRAEHDYRKAIEYARRLLNADPLHEPIVRQLMTAHYQLGDRAAALAEYERFTRLLATELDAPPMPETVALYETVAHNLPLPGSPSTGGARTVSSKEQRVVSQSLPFVGRSLEITRLEGAWRRAARGQGELALVSGEAGAGKSRLCAELATKVEAQGGRLLYGSTSESELAPYQALVSALRGAVPLLAPPAVERASLRAILPLLPELATRLQLAPLPHIEPERERERLYRGLADCLIQLAQARPLLLILEDLHWAGAAMISLLDFLAHRITDQPLLMVATYREEEATRRHPLRELRHQLMQEGHGTHIALGPLLLDDVTQIIRRSASTEGEPEVLARQLYEESEGNAFFLSELITNRSEAVGRDAEGEPLPHGVRSVIVQRLARLSINTRLLAEVASVAGASFDLEVVREVAGWSERQTFDALNQLLDRSIVRDMGGRGIDYAFAHHLIQETVYQGIDAGARTRRHRRLALVLEELYPQREEMAAQLARHFDLGADPQSAAPYYLIAARHAAVLYAYDEAIAAATRAAALTEEPRTRFAALAEAEAIYQRRGERSEQVATLVQMAEIADELGDDDLACEVLRRRIEMHSVLGEREQQAQLIDELATHAQSAPSRRWQATALQLRVNYLLQLAKYDEAHAAASQALSLYQELDDEVAQVECHCLIAEGATFQGRFAEAQQLIAQAHRLANPNSQVVLSRILQASANNVARAGDALASYQLSLRQLDVCRAIHDYEGEADAHGLAARMATQLTYLKEAFDHLGQAKAIYARLGKRSGEASILMRTGLLLFRLASYQECISSLRHAEAIYEQLADLRGMVNSANAYAAIANDAHDFAAAQAAAERSLNLAQKMNSQTFMADALLNLGVAEFGLGKANQAVAHLQAGIDLNRQLQDTGNEDEYEKLCYLAAAYLQAGQIEQATQASAEALALYEAHAERTSKPHYVFWVLACTSHAQGKAQQADDYLKVAYQHFTRWFADREQKLAAFADNDWREFYRRLAFHPHLIATYELGSWPAYAIALLAQRPYHL